MTTTQKKNQLFDFDGPRLRPSRIGTFDIHPMANIRPMKDDDGILKLADQIRAIGLLEGVSCLVDSGEVIDGRSRIAAMATLGREPGVYELNFDRWDQLFQVVVYLNRLGDVGTRNQRALMAARAFAEFESAAHGEDDSRWATKAIAKEHLGVADSTFMRAVMVLSHWMSNVCVALWAMADPARARAATAAMIFILVPPYSLLSAEMRSSTSCLPDLVPFLPHVGAAGAGSQRAKRTNKRTPPIRRQANREPRSANRHGTSRGAFPTLSLDGDSLPPGLSHRSQGFSC